MWRRWPGRWSPRWPSAPRPAASPARPIHPPRPPRRRPRRRPPPGTAPLIAVFPVENLGEVPAPLAALRAVLSDRLQARGMRLIEDAALEQFMQRHRLRYLGGLGREVAGALRAETGATAVLVTSVDVYAGAPPPRLALTSRLVATTDDTRIIWMDSAGMAGDEAPGFLGLGRIDDPLILQETLTVRIANSLARALKASPDWHHPTRPSPARGSRRFRPTRFYRSAGLSRSGAAPLRVAVLPFANASTARHAGDIVTLQIVRHLAASPGIEVIEPGAVRDVLLRSRLIFEGGLSKPQADLLRALLSVDVVVVGEVMDYLDAGGGRPEPEVDFSVRAIDCATRRLTWASVSHSRGDDGVFFFGLGRVPTAHALVSEMTRALVGTILPAVEEQS